MDEIKDLKTLAEWVKKCPAIELSYIIDKLEEYKKALFQYSKFKVGDRVVLVKEPVINENERWGLLAYKHYFKEGASAIIVGVEYFDSSFRYEFRFACNDQNVFCLREEYFELAKNKICSECHREI